MPENRAALVAEVVLALFLLLVLVDILGAVGSKESQSIYLYILRGNWTKGFNLFALTNIAIVDSIAVLSLIFTRIVLWILGNALSAKGETVCRLIRNIIEYAIILFIIFYTFNTLGFDTTALLAGLGFISLALSIGAKDLITDILAGITLVFEGAYQVGDIIQLDNYRGTVQEVGVRSTKLISDNGDVKIIGNGSIRDVVNLTRQNSWCTVETVIDYKHSIADLEAIFEKELPEIGKRIPQIISGPYYRGIQSFTKYTARTGMVILFNAECHEEDMKKVNSALSRELRILFENNKIQQL